jgi:hypothetical protein
LLDELIADETLNCFYGNIPGAGGDDAIFLIGPRDKEPLSLRIKAAIDSKPNLAVLPVTLLQKNEPALQIEFH